MTWQGDGLNTSSNIPAAVRRAVRRRDRDACQLGYVGCTGRYEVFDHTINVARLGMTRAQANTVDRLQCACRSCHQVKTQYEAAIGRGLGHDEPERDHRFGAVAMPAGFRYRPPPGVGRETPAG